MKILGIDPGSIYCGYGFIKAHDKHGQSAGFGKNRQPLYLGSGRIVMSARKPLHLRLKELYTTLAEVISDYGPDEIVIEKMFFAKGIKAALSLGHTRGVVLVTAALNNLNIYEYSALEVKKAVVGYGKADKSQVQEMVKQILSIGHSLSSDSADALALALCHANTMKFGER
ncbi:MAG: crossover junction endodeoxyribonuclease RuvC [Nitrospirae bacterium]|nr:crossover junction endodeoxyribonuclease RuvC [Nitrospirota bacterium]